MKIAQVSPLFESVPPAQYGGTERIVSYLTESLVRLGHDVTLFASADSQTDAKLAATIPRALRLSERTHDAQVCHTLQLCDVARRADEFDVIHFHTDYVHFPLFREIDTPQLTTLHGRLDLPDLSMLFDEFAEMPVVSISDSQRRPVPRANWVSTVYHGIPASNYTFQPNGGGYFVFLGRISQEKRPDRAIEIAIQAGVPLKIAAKVDGADRRYFDDVIAPLLNHPLVEFLGEVDERGKNALLGGAKALLFPIDWPEPFGLVMIESMACGTPVIAFENGSVREVMKDGVTGAIVHSMEEAFAAAHNIEQIDRTRCRQYFEDHYTDDRMARDYVDIYQEVIRRKCNQSRGPVASFAPLEYSSQSLRHQHCLDF